MAEEQSKLRSMGGVMHAKQPHGTGKLAGGEHGHSGTHINAKSHPYPGKTGHIRHFKEHGHAGGSSYQFRERRK